jgi:BirA family biotin operon repressor/biotin-[acetyl-CoA-carboxylase] ligase
MSSPLLEFAADVSRRTGWAVTAYDEVRSTNDEAAARRDAGETRCVVVAACQTEGRGRGGNRFASPRGGLYASLVVTVPVRDVPGPLVVATAVALADAITARTGVAVQVKWPNDLWVDRKKVAGILLETQGVGTQGPRDDVGVVVGVGVNVDGVPAGLPADVALATTALASHAPRPVHRADLLVAFLLGLDRRLAGLAVPEGRAAVVEEYRARLALLDEPVRFLVGDAVRRGILRAVDLDRGVEIEGRDGERSFVPIAHLREMRSDPS